jgi:O-antigen/teichoic acid export membrane protein
MLKHFRQLISESAVYGLGGTVTRFLSVFLIPIYTRIFSPEDYGIMSLVNSTMIIISIFVVLALDNSASRWYWDSEDVEHRKATISSWAWCQITLSTIFAVAIWLAADELGNQIVKRADAAAYFRLAALTLPLGVLGAVVTSWLRLRRKPWVTVTFMLVTNILTMLLTIFFVIYLRWGLSGIYWGQIVSLACGSIISLYLLRDWVNPRHFRWDRLREMLRFAFPLIPAALAFWIVNFSDRYFVQIYTSTQEVGLYQVGSSLAAFVALVTSAFQQAWGPFAMSIHKQEDARQVYASVFLAYLWLTSLICTALTLFAPQAIRLLATQRYMGATTVVSFLSFSYAMIGLSYIAAIGPAIARTSAPTGIAVTIAAALNILFNFLLVPRMGKTGSAMATLLSQSVGPIILFYFAQRLYPIPYRFIAGGALLAFSALLIWLGGHWQFDTLLLDAGWKLSLLLLFIPALFVARIVTFSQVARLFRAPPLSA